MIIRPYQESDWQETWPLLKDVFRAGETYAYSPNITQEKAKEIWIQNATQTYVCVAENTKILGTYFIKPNQPELGSHVCNCGYIVAKNARGQGIATKMCQHSQKIAKQFGFRAMQYNLVVTSNLGAIHLWKKLGFKTIGILPKAFKSKSRGYTDALVMYKELQ